MKLLFRSDEDGRQVRVIERRWDGARLYYEDGALYTHVDAEGANLLRYITEMDRALEDTKNVLLLGTAGGALATQLSRRGARVTTVDNWSMTFEIARRWFRLPPQVECVHADAMQFLRSTSRRWDAIAVDVFRGVEIPESMLASDIGALLTQVLTPGGLIVWNVADSPQSWPTQWISKALRLAGYETRLVSVLEDDAGNTLVVSRQTPAPNGETETALGPEVAKTPVA
ncbi:spermidine synthase [Phenylobacterium sp.]|uniref:spermidine synthase n=1 Tax=Phenylobacterium sp. TaxID=1871053 RepID=UPI003BA8DD69